VVRQPAYQTLADDLRDQIVSGRLRPGDRLPAEPALCVSSGLSRSTVREALRLLSSQNLIITTRGVAGGSFVAHPSPDQVSDAMATGVGLLLSNSVVTGAHVIELRGMLEVPAAAAAALRRTDADLEALRRGRFDPNADSLSEMLDQHRAYHRALFNATGNPLISLMSRPLYAVTNERESAQPHGRDIWIQVAADHEAILAAIEARDSDGARLAAQAHIDHLSEAFDARMEWERANERVISAEGAA
jgi:DNA-binding FadR family transcriptional regulator